MDAYPLAWGAFDHQLDMACPRAVYYLMHPWQYACHGSALRLVAGVGPNNPPIPSALDPSVAASEPGDLDPTSSGPASLALPTGSYSSRDTNPPPNTVYHQTWAMVKISCLG